MNKIFLLITKKFLNDDFFFIFYGGKEHREHFWIFKINDQSIVAIYQLNPLWDLSDVSKIFHSLIE